MNAREQRCRLERFRRDDFPPWRQAAVAWWVDGDVEQRGRRIDCIVSVQS